MGLLEAFFVGRALAETVNERLGGALADALAEFGRRDAELRQAARCGGRSRLQLSRRAVKEGWEGGWNSTAVLTAQSNDNCQATAEHAHYRSPMHPPPPLCVC